MTAARSFLPTNPSSGEESNYNRKAVAFVFSTRTFVWVWRFDVKPATMPQVRLVDGDGTPLTSWVSPVNDLYYFSLNVDNAHHLARPQFSFPVADCAILEKAFVVNDTDAPLPVQNPWAGTTRNHGESLAPAAPTVFPSPAPYAARALKGRIVEPFTTRLTQSQLWIRRLTINSRDVMFRSFFKTKKGDVIVVPWQKYTYLGEAVSSEGMLVGPTPPRAIVRDGPRNIARMGYVSKMILRDGGKGVYFWETNGRSAFMSFVEQIQPAQPAGELKRGGGGYINTFAGWRVNGLPTWDGPVGDGWEYVGDWSRVSGAHYTEEVWGGCVAMRRADGTLTDRDGLDAWTNDTRNHRIIYEDRWAGHADVQGETGRPSVAQFSPAGYSTPAVRGKTVMVDFAGTCGVPTALCNEPWNSGFRTQDGKVYWDNFGGDSFAYSTTDCSDQQVLVSNPGGAKTDAQLGIPSRLYPSTMPVGQLRDLFLKDGPFGVASIVRPQGWDFTANGDIVFVERYTYAVRLLSFATRTITTLCLIPENALNGSMAKSYQKPDPANPGQTITVQSVVLTNNSSSTQDFDLAIDRNGTFGPAGDIFINGWAGPSLYRISASGTFLGRIFDLSVKPCRNGPGDMVDPPNYAWAVAVHEGRMVVAGNDSGSSFIEVTKRQPTDVIPNLTAFVAGYNAYKAKLNVSHGDHGYGEIGYPNVEQLAAMPSAERDAYFLAQGFTAADLPNLREWVRHSTCDYDNTAPPPVDTLPPAALTIKTVLTATYGGSMYTITLQNIAGPETDIVKGAFSVNGGAPIEVPATPGQAFSAQTQVADSGPISVDAWVIDAAGNPALHRNDVLIVPDKAAPQALGTATKLAAAVWVGA